MRAGEKHRGIWEPSGRGRCGPPSLPTAAPQLPHLTPGHTTAPSYAPNSMPPEQPQV